MRKSIVYELKTVVDRLRKELTNIKYQFTKDRQSQPQHTDQRHAMNDINSED